MNKKTGFIGGIIDGTPICLGYLSVAFAFGVFSIKSGLTVLEALLISMTNVTSAGQLAGVPIIAAGGTFSELAITQLVINLRYSLMSVSMSQKFDSSIRFADRFPIAFVNTDEVFASVASKSEKVGRNYMYGLILMPYLGWSVGTFAGAIAGDIFPAVLTSALGVAIYGMFIATVIPEAKKSVSSALCVATSVILSCIFRFIPFLSSIPEGFTIIICALIAGVLFAVIAPIKECELAESGGDAV